MKMPKKHLLSICFILFILFVQIPNINAQTKNSYASNKVIVKYTSNQISNAQKRLTRTKLNIQSFARTQKENVEIWTLSETQGNTTQKENSIREFINNAKTTLEGIEYIEPDFAYDAQINPNDPSFPLQWGLENTGQTGGTQNSDMMLPQAWELHTGSKRIIVGVIDTGVDFLHDDLAPNIWQNLAEDADNDGHTIEFINNQWVLDPGDLDNIDADGNGYVDDLVGWDFVNDDNNPLDDNNHGTHVAGSIGARGNNGKGITGVNWDTQIMVLKAFDAEGTGGLTNIVEALAYARAMGAHITNNSWGGSAYSQALFDEIDANRNEGQLLIAAAGNIGSNNDNTPIYPASYEIDNIISVGSSDHNDQLSSFSNYGLMTVDLLAPGSDIYSTLPNNQYGSLSGTSMAAAHVSGVAALLWSYMPNKSPKSIKTRILNATDRCPGMEAYSLTGGRLNAARTLNPAAASCIQYTNFLQGKKVRDIYTSGDNVWLATNKGVYVIDQKNCTRTQYTKRNSGLPTNNIHAVRIDDTGNMWLGTQKGLAMFDGTQWTVWDTLNSCLSSQKILSIGIHNSAVWVGTHKEIAKIEAGGNLVTIQTGVKIRDIEMVNETELWAATNQGLIHIQNSNLYTYTKQNSGLPKNSLTSITKADDGSIWVGTKTAGLAHFDGTNWAVLNTSNSPLPNNAITDVALDKLGQLVIGIGKPNDLTQPAGIMFQNNGQWNYHKRESSPLPHPIANVLYIDQENNTWVGTPNGFTIFFERIHASFSTAEQDICQFQSVDFTNQSDLVSSYKWYVNNMLETSDQDLNYTFSEPGTYIVTLVAENGFVTDMHTQIIEVAPFPVADLGADVAICAESYQFDAGIDGLTYEWTDANGDIVSTERIFTAITSGTYTLTMSNPCGDVSSDQVQLSLTGGCVWPGDVNTDGQVNLLDFLWVGFANGEAGTTRPNASHAYTSQPSPDWGSTFTETNALGQTVDYKHADCDGDGNVDMQTDGAVVKQNINSRMNLPSNTGGGGLQLEFIQNDSIQILAEQIIISYTIELYGPEGGDAENVYSVGMSIDFEFEDPIEVDVDCSNSWLSPAACEKEFYAEESILDVVVTSIDGGNKTGRGKLFDSDIIITLDEVQGGGNISANQILQINKIFNVVAFDNEGNSIPVSASYSSNAVMNNGQSNASEGTPSIQQFTVYPNPAEGDFVNLAFLSETTGQFELRFTDIHGKVVQQQMVEANQGFNTHQLSIQNLSKGFYFIELTNGSQRMVKKLNIN